MGIKLCWLWYICCAAKTTVLCYQCVLCCFAAFSRLCVFNCTCVTVAADCSSLLYILSMAPGQIRVNNLLSFARRAGFSPRPSSTPLRCLPPSAAVAVCTHFTPRYGRVPKVSLFPCRSNYNCKYYRLSDFINCHRGLLL